ncbi:MAG: hypothetical protein ACYC3O_08140 [Burkholderiales bacterium]
MKFFLGLAFVLLSRSDHAGRRQIMREALNYRQLNLFARKEYKPPDIINKNKRRLLILAFVMVAIDQPNLIGWFFLSSFIFSCLMLTRLFVYLFE